MHQTDTRDAYRVSVAQARTRRATVMQEYRKMTPSAEAKRVAFGEELAKSRAQKYSTSVAVQKKMIGHCFKQRQAATRIREVTKLAQQNVAYVTDGQPASPQHHYTKEAIEEACMREGTARFTQAYGTPFTVPPLATDFPGIGAAPIEEVLLGTVIMQSSFMPRLTGTNLEYCRLGHQLEDPLARDIL